NSCRDARSVYRVRSVLGLVDSAAREDVGGVTADCKDRRVECVDGVDPAFHEFVFRDGELFRETEINLLNPGTTSTANRATAKFARRRERHGGGVEPNVTAAHEILERGGGRGRIAIRTGLEVCAGGIVAELDHGNREAAVSSE